MRDRRAKFNMAHSFPPDDGACDFHAALVADDALIADAFVLAAVTFVILFRTEDFLVKEPMLLAPLGAVIDGLRLGYFAGRPREDALRRREREAQTVPGVAGNEFTGSKCHK